MHELEQRYRQTRQQSLDACEPLEIEDYGLQAEVFTSPPKWHLAHTSWFFETFLLTPYLHRYQPLNASYTQLFNSYYNGVGAQFARSARGLLSRPTLKEVVAYREHVDVAMIELLGDIEHSRRPVILSRARLGIEHEQQHQELFYTDLKYSLSVNPLLPCYREENRADHGGAFAAEDCAVLHWLEFPGGLTSIGVDPGVFSEDDFAFDNESPEHSVNLAPYALANRLVTNSEYQAFVDDGGYRDHAHWLADGWNTVQQEQWTKPLYWYDRDGEQLQFTLAGLQPRHPHQPVCHLSGYEADAFASWSDARLPTEFEWEAAARAQPFLAHTFDAKKLHPQPAGGDMPLLQLYGDCWQWTGSSYRPYPGFKASAGAIGEYNGKFMANQWVLRGGSCVTPGGHVRASYRNFFYPQDRWQFSGLRLAKDL